MTENICLVKLAGVHCLGRNGKMLYNVHFISGKYSLVSIRMFPCTFPLSLTISIQLELHVQFRFLLWKVCHLSLG